jgi:NAD(P)-dependent dehydrogenase (short-subunit alcohol dehydrogenase family)
MAQSRVALVTGGGKGLGEAIAVALRAEGHKLVLLGRDESALARVAKETGGMPLVCDVTDSAALDKALDRAENEMGNVDILVHNAGIALSAPLARTTDEDIDRIFQVNVRSAFHLARRLVPRMAERRWGRVVNVASVAGITGLAFGSAYSASKHALIGLTRSIALEFATRGVTANAVCPAFCETAMATQAIEAMVEKAKRTPEEARAALQNLNPQQRMIPPSEVAHVVAMLTSESASSVNGQAIPIDGGMVMK